jgi:tetratricopeptide (TPR) repeat protein
VKNHTSAEEQARKSLESDPDLAAAHGALGAALAGQGKCAEALPELKIALEADPADATALEARKACGRWGPSACAKPQATAAGTVRMPYEYRTHTLRRRRESHECNSHAVPRRRPTTPARVSNWRTEDA